MENIHTLIMQLITLDLVDTELCLLTIVKYLSIAIMVMVPMDIMILVPSKTGTSLHKADPRCHSLLKIDINVNGIHMKHMVMSDMLKLTMYRFRGVCICDFLATTKHTIMLAQTPIPISKTYIIIKTASQLSLKFRLDFWYSPNILRASSMLKFNVLFNSCIPHFFEKNSLKGQNIYDVVTIRIISHVNGTAIPLDP